jgi:hypothetical protein
MFEYVSTAGEIEVGMICQIDDGVLVGGCSILDSQLVVVVDHIINETFRFPG